MQDESQLSGFESIIKNKILVEIEKSLKIKQIIIKHKISEKVSPDSGKPYTATEKFDFLAAQNPILQKLRDEFNLEIE